jgi:DNA-binding FadR family transcriptional regulator
LRAKLGGESLPFVTVEPTRLYRQIAGQIATLIANGEFATGGRLPSERDLSALLGVSRTSVREAIIALEMSGLVEVRVGTGIFVTERLPRSRSPLAAAKSAQDGGLSPFELLAARRTIEGEIAAMAAASTRRRDIEDLDATLAAMREHAGDHLRRDAADRAFHVRIAEITRNSALAWVVGSLWDQRQGQIFARLESRFHTAELRARTLDDHAAIISALAAHDADGARKAMHRHLARVTREFQRHWEGDSARGAPPSSRGSRRTRGSTATRRET